MMMGQRKHYFIMKGMQTKLILVIMLLFLLVAVITFFNVYILTQFFKSQVLEESRFQKEEVDMVVQKVFAAMKSRLLLLVFIDILVIIMVGVIFSHQIAGPAFNLERVIRRVAGGELHVQTRLRRGDQLGNLADAFNSMARALQGNIATICEHSEALEKTIQDLPGAGKTLEAPQLEAVQGQLEELKGALSAFQVQEPEEPDETGEEANETPAEPAAEEDAAEDNTAQG